MMNVILPELGEGIEKAEIVSWLAVPGDRVSLDQDILELVTDKAVFNVPAPVSGVLGKVYYHPGDEVSVGSVVAEIEANDEKA